MSLVFILLLLIHGITSSNGRAHRMGKLSGFLERTTSVQRDLREAPRALTGTDASNCIASERAENRSPTNFGQYGSAWLLEPGHRLFQGHVRIDLTARVAILATRRTDDGAIPMSFPGFSSMFRLIGEI